MPTAIRTIATAFGLALATPAIATTEAPSPVVSALDTLQAGRFIDLSHPFSPGIPHWKGYPDETVRSLFTIEKSGFQTDLYCHVGQFGTHVDAPGHFFVGLNTLDQIPPRDMLLRLVVLDIHEAVARNPDYAVTLADVRAWEARHGPVPEGAFVALRTDWSKRWPDDAALHNRDPAGVVHTPGWSLEVLTYLYEDRHAVATGHETADADPGRATVNGAPLEAYVLRHNHFQIELMANLDQIPENGAAIVVSFPKAEGGTGFPARAIAIAP